MGVDVKRSCPIQQLPFRGESPGIHVGGVTEGAGKLTVVSAKPLLVMIMMMLFFGRRKMFFASLVLVRLLFLPFCCKIWEHTWHYLGTSSMVFCKLPALKSASPPYSLVSRPNIRSGLASDGDSRQQKLCPSESKIPMWL